ncbi:MAG: hypothetical protein MUO29_11165 [Desulfobacterales bacterium]|nr:hypothetical protein [Desulfobacterales bacterium]
MGSNANPVQTTALNEKGRGESRPFRFDGAGLELDTSALDRWATRWRLIGRYRFGQNVTGYGISLGISFWREPI